MGELEIATHLKLQNQLCVFPLHSRWTNRWVCFVRTVMEVAKVNLKKRFSTFCQIPCQTFYGICLTLPLFGGLWVRKLSSQRFSQILSDLVQTARFMLLLPESHLHGRRRGDVIIIVRLPNHCQRPHRSCAVIYISSTDALWSGQ